MLACRLFDTYLLIYLHKCLPACLHPFLCLCILTYLHQYLLALVSRHLTIYLPTCLPIYLPGCLSLQFTTQLQIYTNSHLPSYPTAVAKYYTTFPKYFPDGCFVVYRLLFASFLVNSKLVRPYRSLFGPFRSLFGPFRFFSVLFGFFFGPFRCLGQPRFNPYRVKGVNDPWITFLLITFER